MATKHTAETRAAAWEITDLIDIGFITQHRNKKHETIEAIIEKHKTPAEKAAPTLQARIDRLKGDIKRLEAVLEHKQGLIDRLLTEKDKATEQSIAQSEINAENEGLEAEKAELKTVLIHCFQYMTGTKPGPDTNTIMTELQQLMDDFGVTGIAKAQP